MQGSLSSIIYRTCDWIMKLAIVNLLWISFTLLGLVVFGLAPATAALFSVIRKWVMGDTDIPIFKTFWTNYRKGFIKANILGIIFLVLGYILNVNFRFVITYEGAWQPVLLCIVVITGVIYLLTLIYIFPVLAHFELPNIGQYIKNAFLIGISQLPSTLFMIGGLFLSYLIFRIVPATLIFYCASLISFFIYWSAHRSFVKIVIKRHEAES